MDLSASMNTRSNGPSTAGSDSRAAPTRTRTRSPRPASTRLACATAACLGSNSRVTTAPSGPTALASHAVL
ncbi:Uncharacterised protein [Mycobacteroides abscessus subsp. abscessus]|nr:Uncharacterised protein [Mycobacteroides abscessus subsp. abscessus]